MDRAMNAVGDCIHNKLCFPFAENPKKYITYAWFASIILVVIVFICACALADKHRGGGTTAFGFAAVWTTIMCVAVALGGTVVMRKFQTAYAIGAFLGVIAVLANQCLILVAVFGTESGNDSGHKKQTDDVFSVFMFFIACVYIFFAALLAVFRNDLIKEEPTNGDVPVVIAQPAEEDAVSA
ncbi:hypothetical protein M885DRAFT_614647 [Pelagophyceae sp. CCMP2097]|nr:hypothetical protein M885DRAFT_614647 [Pelagophyceae sp. CCMP2097]